MQGNLLYIAILLISNGVIHAQTIAPGGIDTDLELWLKADKGTVGIPTVTNWTDQSPLGNSALAGGNPQLVTNGLNYNPSIAFDGTGDYFNAAADIQSNSNAVYVVNKVGSIGTPSEGIFSIMDDDISKTYDGANPESGALLLRQGAVSKLRSRVDNVNINSVSGILDDQFHIYAATMGATDMYLYNNAFLESSNTYVASFSAEEYYLGCRYYNAAPAKFMSGEFAEVIHYNFEPGASARNKIETYLAIKYGITLSNIGGGTQGDYTATTGDNIWDADNNVSCHNHVIGIGREDSQDLYQKQSHTIDDTTRIYLSALAVSNAANTGTINDYTYVMIGDNNRKMSTSVLSNAEIPGTCGLYSRIEREWKVRRVSSGSAFNLDLTLGAPAIAGGIAVSDLRVLIDDDGDFSNGGTTCYFNGDGTGIALSFASPVLTITGISTTHIANNAVRYLTIGSIRNSTPLPIDLVSNRVQCKAENVEVEWTTNSEVNNDYFSIERSSTGTDFELLATIDGALNSSETHEYTWVDSNPYLGASYYRLSQTDLDGSKEYYPVQVAHCTENNTFSIYPNPFDNVFTITSKQKGVIEVYNQIGQILLSASIVEGLNYIESVLLDKGVYFIRISMNNGATVCEKLTKL
ncbi:MAG: T9SS type A sorting domain-containing protein [Crocinitomicaceae bacterium]|nr:T9SS type A sorting domain-containing protein [Crocinitomicaceae bacterium]MBT6030115.1 T9SS type A sorting domain-containing protein [Crocinitomicaceae bacterium]